MLIREYLKEKQLDTLFTCIMMCLPKSHYNQACMVLDTEIDPDKFNCPIDVFYEKYCDKK